MSQDHGGLPSSPKDPLCDDPIWDLGRDRVHQEPKNPDRLLHGDMAETFFQAVLKQARERNLLSDEHPTVGFLERAFSFRGS